MLLYSASHHSSDGPKALTLFLKSQGISAKSLDALHAFGITMSYKWSHTAIDNLANSQMQEVCNIVKTRPWFMSYDNVNIPFRTYAQRLDRQDHFDSGTAATVFVPSQSLPTPNLSFERLQLARAAGGRAPISIAKIFQLERDASPHIHKRHVWRVIKFLIDTPDFDFQTYPHRDDQIFTPPPPRRLLPCGPEYVTKQYMLHTRHIDESSFDGNDQLLSEWQWQLGLSDPAEQKITGTQRVIAVNGDQLTVNRLHGLIRMRAEDFNGSDRLDWLQPVFGWFHLQMTVANLLHKQYSGTAAGRGLMHAVALLSRKHLGTVQIKGPFYHHLHELILHVAEAHFRSCWKVIAGVPSIRDLHTRTPAELLQYAEALITQLASSNLFEDEGTKKDKERDEVFKQTVRWNRDVLQYIELHEAIQCGDIGWMEDLLPTLLMRFAGGGNGKYAIEVLELLQGLHCEWPSELW